MEQKLTIGQDEPSTWLEIRLYNAALAEARRRLPGDSEADHLVYAGRRLASLLAMKHGYDVDRAAAEKIIREMLATPAAAGVVHGGH